MLNRESILKTKKCKNLPPSDGLKIEKKIRLDLYVMIINGYC
jgi:hypothetical protein